MTIEQSKNKKTPVIPEPSPRFILWSAVVAAFLLVGVLVYDYTTDQWPGSAAASTSQSHK
jgi:hypothetical protein